MTEGIIRHPSFESDEDIAAIFTRNSSKPETAIRTPGDGVFNVGRLTIVRSPYDAISFGFEKEQLFGFNGKLYSIDESAVIVPNLAVVVAASPARPKILLASHPNADEGLRLSTEDHFRKIIRSHKKSTIKKEGGWPCRDVISVHGVRVGRQHEDPEAFQHTLGLSVHLSHYYGNKAFYCRNGSIDWRPNATKSHAEEFVRLANDNHLAPMLGLRLYTKALRVR